jgi:hypothetical protein
MFMNGIYNVLFDTCDSDFIFKDGVFGENTPCEAVKQACFEKIFDLISDTEINTEFVSAPQ